ncbi:UNVERIFIED_CONTAM: LINE-1 retrotransposable element O protein [Sesamum latifolium]|uniref:LINE-1 retrotransposable element O protein n=1 Tax=Sesamum latifolium TaxID=2727402 RepID=A0AAW2SQX1_9LAMI
MWIGLVREPIWECNVQNPGSGSKQLGPDCDEVVRHAWSLAQAAGATVGLTAKIRATRMQLMQWDKTSFGNIRHQSKELNDKICALERKDITTATKIELEGLHDSLEQLGTREEILWKQHAKALWLKAGDRNTSFLHAKANEHRVRKEIQKIQNEKGDEISDKEGIQKVVVRYFRTIFASTNPTPESVEEVLWSLDRQLTPAMSEALLQPFSAEEVSQALKQIHPLKSPGLDGMSPIFFQKYWSIVGPDVCSSVLDFLNTSYFDPLMNFTQIVIIPKCPNPTDMTHFRPISLCNVLYKLASKAIANRIKPFLDTLISTSQVVFVLGRLITGNVLVAYELNHFLKHKNKGKKAEHTGAITGVAVSRSAPSIFHLLFADDTLIYCQTTSNAMRCLRDILLKFEKASSLKINLQKFAMVFSRNVDEGSCMELANILGVAVVPKHEKYLGLPTIAGRSKRELFESIKDRIWSKLHCWLAKKLSQAGRGVLLKIVLQSIPIYAMGCFRLPDSFL